MRSPPLVSKVAFTTSVVMVTFSLDTGTAAPAAGVAAVGVAPATVAAAGTPAADGAVLAGAAPDAATGLGTAGANIDGWPLCVFQASQSITSETENTIQRMERRMSVMDGSSKKANG